jgi:hypothetical protein
LRPPTTEKAADILLEVLLDWDYEAMLRCLFLCAFLCVILMLRPIRVRMLRVASRVAAFKFLIRMLHKDWSLGYVFRSTLPFICH